MNNKRIHGIIINYDEAEIKEQGLSRELKEAIKYLEDDKDEFDRLIKSAKAMTEAQFELNDFKKTKFEIEYPHKVRFVLKPTD